MSDEEDSEVGERAVAEIQAFLLKAQSLSVNHVEQVAEQFRVDAMLAKTTPRRRKIYDAVADYFEHVAEERHRKAKENGEDDEEEGFGGAVKAIVESFEGDDRD